MCHRYKQQKNESRAISKHSFPFIQIIHSITIIGTRGTLQTDINHSPRSANMLHSKWSQPYLRSLKATEAMADSFPPENTDCLEETQLTIEKGGVFLERIRPAFHGQKGEHRRDKNTKKGRPSRIFLSASLKNPFNSGE